MLYNVVLISTVQQSKSAIGFPVSPLLQISFPFRSPHWVKFPILCSRFSLVFYFIHSLNNVYMSIPISVPFPFLFGIHRCVLYLCISISRQTLLMNPMTNEWARGLITLHNSAVKSGWGSQKRPYAIWLVDHS